MLSAHHSGNGATIFVIPWPKLAEAFGQLLQPVLPPVPVFIRFSGVGLHTAEKRPPDTAGDDMIMGLGD